MRLIPLITALLVTAAMYFMVFERDRVMAFAKGTDAAGAAEETQDTTTAEAPDAIGVVAIRSDARPIDSAVILRGQTQAARRVVLHSETASTVISAPLRKGAYVKAGDVLCELDPGTREASLAEAEARLIEARSRVPESEAGLESALARLEEAQINWNAAEKLSKGGYTSDVQKAAAAANRRAAQAGIESANAARDAAKAGIQSAEAGVAAAKREIDRLTIEAPFDGLLESDTAELGSLLLAGGRCAEIIQLNPIKVVGYVPEAEVDRVELGALAGAELSTGKQVQGRVTFLSRSADPTTRTFEVEITVPNTDLAIRDGQTANIAISAEGTQAHNLPQSSLTLNNDGQLGVRIVAENNIVDFRPVTLLRDDANGVWVDGLPDRADVIIVGQDFVTKGVTVAPTYREVAQ
jgi:multidrug efflux system membrane fusion protein